MTCCASILQTFRYSTYSLADEIEYGSAGVEKFYKNRPSRTTGIYFLYHRNHLTDILEVAVDCLIGEPISIWEESFSVHPSGHPLCEEFVSLRLSPEFVEKHPDVIRMASYRWLDVKGVGLYGRCYQAPSKYVWFLEWLKENVMLGWMDLMANIVVNVKVMRLLHTWGTSLQS